MKIKLHCAVIIDFFKEKISFFKNIHNKYTCHNTKNFHFFMAIALLKTLLTGLIVIILIANVSGTIFHFKIEITSIILPYIMSFSDKIILCSDTI